MKCERCKKAPAVVARPDPDPSRTLRYLCTDCSRIDYPHGGCKSYGNTDRRQDTVRYREHSPGRRLVDAWRMTHGEDE